MVVGDSWETVVAIWTRMCEGNSGRPIVIVLVGEKGGEWDSTVVGDPRRHRRSYEHACVKATVVVVTLGHCIWRCCSTFYCIMTIK